MVIPGNALRILMLGMLALCPLSVRAGSPAAPYRKPLKGFTLTDYYYPTIDQYVDYNGDGYPDLFLGDRVMLNDGALRPSFKEQKITYDMPKGATLGPVKAVARITSQTKPVLIYSYTKLTRKYDEYGNDNWSSETRLILGREGTPNHYSGPILATLPAGNGESDYYGISGVDYSVGDIRVEDVDGDGVAEILYSVREYVYSYGDDDTGGGDYSTTLHMLKSKTGASFQAWSDTVVLPKNAAASMNVLGWVDLNHDGKKDLVTLQYLYSDSPTGYIGYKNIHLAVNLTLTTSPLTFASTQYLAFFKAQDTSVIDKYVLPHDVQFLDFNRDGYPDIFCLDGDYTLYVLENKAGAFTTPPQPINYQILNYHPLGYGPDGGLMLFLREFSWGLENAGSVLEMVSAAPLKTNYWQALFNGNDFICTPFDPNRGVAEVYVISRASAVRYQYQGGKPVKFKQSPLIVPWTGYESNLELPFYSGDFNGFSGLADLNGDGQADLVLGFFDSYYKPAIYINHTSQFSTSQTLAKSVTGAAAVCVADMDKDGRPDVVSAAAGQDQILWHRNRGGSPPVFQTFVVSSQVKNPVGLCVADLNRDGRPDVIAASQDDHTFAWFENIGGTRMTFIKHALTTAADKPQAVAVADVDGDGDLDILAASRGDDTFWWFENNGAARPAFKAHKLATGVKEAYGIAAADLDGDGHMDILCASRGDNTISWFQNDGRYPATFKKRVITTGAKSVRSVCAADLNGDGRLDVLAASADDGTVAWYENNGARPPAFTKHVITDKLTGANSVAVADLNGDGKPDLLATASDGTIVWFVNEGGNPPVFRRWAIDTQATGVRGAAVADLDGDKALDVIGAIAGRNAVAWYQNLK